MRRYSYFTEEERAYLAALHDGTIEKKYPPKDRARLRENLVPSVNRMIHDLDIFSEMIKKDKGVFQAFIDHDIKEYKKTASEFCETYKNIVSCDAWEKPMD